MLRFTPLHTCTQPLSRTLSYSTLLLSYSLTHSMMTDGRSNGKIVTVATLLLTPSATLWSQGRQGDKSRGRQTQWARRGSQWRHGGTECPPGTRRTEGLYRAVRRRSASHGASHRTRGTQNQDRNAPCPLAVACGVVSADAPLLAVGVDVQDVLNHMPYGGKHPGDAMQAAACCCRYRCAAAATCFEVDLH